MGESEKGIALPGEFLFVYNGQEGDWGRQEQRECPQQIRSGCNGQTLAGYIHVMAGYV